jgi:hypothetical protein
VDEVGLRLRDAVIAPGQRAAGDEDGVPGGRAAHGIGPRIAPLAARRIARQAATATDPGDPLRVDVDVVRIVGQAVVAAEIDRIGERLRMRRVPEVGDPDRAAVSSPGVNDPRYARSSRRAGPPVHTYRHPSMQLVVCPTGSSMKSPIWVRSVELA